MPYLEIEGDVKRDNDFNNFKNNEKLSKRRVAKLKTHLPNDLSSRRKRFAQRMTLSITTKVS